MTDLKILVPMAPEFLAELEAGLSFAGTVTLKDGQIVLTKREPCGCGESEPSTDPF